MQSPQPTRPLSRRGCLVAILIFLSLGICGYIGSKNTLAPQSQPTPTPTAIAQIATPTSASTPTPTPTQKPHKGPSRAQLDEAIVPAYPPITIESYKQSNGTLVVAISYGERVNWRIDVLKRVMADTQDVFWQHTDWYFASVKVNVYELLVAGGQRKMAYGTLTYVAAQAINWQPGDYGDLWGAYDQKWIDPRVPAA